MSDSPVPVTFYSQEAWQRIVNNYPKTTYEWSLLMTESKLARPAIPMTCERTSDCPFEHLVLRWDKRLLAMSAAMPVWRHIEARKARRKKEAEDAGVG